jgi:hypothetical protein
LSLEAVRMRWPSGLNTALFTELVWPGAQDGDQRALGPYHPSNFLVRWISL